MESALHGGDKYNKNGGKSLHVPITWQHKKSSAAAGEVDRHL